MILDAGFCLPAIASRSLRSELRVEDRRGERGYWIKKECFIHGLFPPPSVFCRPPSTPYCLLRLFPSALCSTLYALIGLRSDYEIFCQIMVIDYIHFGN
jgi:hypothetical protein